MSDKIEDQNPDSSVEVGSEVVELELNDLEQKIDEIARLFEEHRERKAAFATPSVEQRWINVMNRVFEELEPECWVRDASVRNYVHAGELLEARVVIKDHSWASGIGNDAVVVNHRYDCDFYEVGHGMSNGIVGEISVTVAVSFDLMDIQDDDNEQLNEEFNELGSLDNPEALDRFGFHEKTGLYQHSWPILRKYVEKTVEEFYWGPIDFPENRV